MLVEIKGKYALFSRPELKAERFSYEVPTRTALAGLLKQIYWKPEMNYIIKKVYVINRPMFLSIMTNSQSVKLTENCAEKCMKGASITIDRTKNATPRSCHVLKNVHYVIDVEIILTGKGTSEDDSVRKHTEILSRRIEKGQYYRVPCLGAKEFGCEITLTDYIPVSENRGIHYLGYMLNDFNYDKPQPTFKRLEMVDGCVDFEKASEVKHGWLFEELVNFYDANREKYELPLAGLSREKITYECVIDYDGNFKAFNALNVNEKGKVLPVMMDVPEFVKGRTANIKPNFLYDNEKYVFGMDTDPAKMKAFINRIKQITPMGTSAETDALLKFYEKNKGFSDELFGDYLLKDKKDNKSLNGVIIFRLEDMTTYIHDGKIALEKWQAFLQKEQSENTSICKCMVTGKEGVLSTMHPLIKGVINASAFAKLVSMEKSSTAFESNGLKSFENSPFTEETVFKYSAALNYLLGQNDHRISIGNSTFVYWSDTDNITLLRKITYMLAGFKDEDEPLPISDDERFYILELRANSSRLVVNRFNSYLYGNKDLSKQMIDMCSEIQYEYKDAKISTHWDSFKIYEEGEKNMENKSRAYTLGTLMALLEKAQKDAVSSVKGTSTTADKNIEIASQKPARVFPQMLSMSRHHLNKVDYGIGRKIENVMDKLSKYDDPFPNNLNNKEQCEFHIGYNHQRKIFREEYEATVAVRESKNNYHR